MPGKEGKILLAMSGLEPGRWRELLAQRREVVVEPNGAEDATIDYAVVWKQQPNLLSRLPNLKVIFSVGAGVFLVVWWARHWHRTRRSARLVGAHSHPASRGAK